MTETSESKRGSAALSHLPFVISAGLCLLVFTWLITDGSFALIYPESYGNFYDYQAKSILAGHLDVPRVAISGEAFVFHGKDYGYFGIMPALLRIPFVLAGVAFGKLSRLYMVGYYIAALLAGYAILRHLVRVQRRPDARPSAASVVLLTLNLGLGSALFFLGSRAFLYHEAILSGAAFALWGSYFSLRYLESPSWLRAACALVMGLCAVHCRPTTGLYSLCLVAAVAGIGLYRERRQGFPGARLHIPVFLLSGAAFFTFNVVSYLKFQTLEGMPQRYALQFIINPNRLKTIEGKNLHLCNLHINAAAYIYSFNFVKMDSFPYFHQMWESASYFPEAKMDTCEEVVGLPYSMPALALLAILGVVGGVRRMRLRGPMLASTAAFLPMAVVLFTAVSDTHRYTGDFVPFLAVASAAGLAAVEDTQSFRYLRIILIPLTIAAFLVNFALVMYFQGVRPGTSTAEGVVNYRHVTRWVDRIRAAF